MKTRMGEVEGEEEENCPSNGAPPLPSGLLCNCCRHARTRVPFDTCLLFPVSRPFSLNAATGSIGWFGRRRAFALVSLFSFAYKGLLAVKGYRTRVSRPRVAEFVLTAVSF